MCVGSSKRSLWRFWRVLANKTKMNTQTFQYSFQYFAVFCFFELWLCCSGKMENKQQTILSPFVSFTSGAHFSTKEETTNNNETKIKYVHFCVFFLLFSIISLVFAVSVVFSRFIFFSTFVRHYKINQLSLLTCHSKKCDFVSMYSLAGLWNITIQSRINNTWSDPWSYVRYYCLHLDFNGLL